MGNFRLNYAMDYFGMWHSINELKLFYQMKSGRIARRFIKEVVTQIWSDLKGLDVAGIGYASPYFTANWIGEANSCYALMPAEQGVEHWAFPKEGSNLNASVLMDGNNMPFDSNSFDRIFIVHMLEYTENRRKFLRESWRVLKDGGKLLIVIPSRRGLWSRYESTPFGHGHPFTRIQLYKLLRLERFEPVSLRRALYLPPTENPYLLKLAKPFEIILSKLLPRLGGVIIIEAEKRIFMPLIEPVQSFREKFIAQSIPQAFPSPNRLQEEL